MTKKGKTEGKNIAGLQVGKRLQREPCRWALGQRKEVMGVNHSKENLG